MLPATTRLTLEQARDLTEEVKADAAALWAKLLTLYEGEAHIALGYSAWGDYYTEEFGESKSRGYQLLEAARVDRTLVESNMLERPATDRVARELAPLKDDEQELVQAWREAQANAAEHGVKVTTKALREVVQERIGRATARVVRERKAAEERARWAESRCDRCGRSKRQMEDEGDDEPAWAGHFRQHDGSHLRWCTRCYDEWKVEVGYSSWAEYCRAARFPDAPVAARKRPVDPEVVRDFAERTERAEAEIKKLQRHIAEIRDERVAYHQSLWDRPFGCSGLFWEPGQEWRDPDGASCRSEADEETGGLIVRYVQGPGAVA